MSSLGQLWTDGGNPHCQVLVLIFLFSFHSPCIAMCKCLCRHHNIQIITFTFCCNLYKTLHKHVIFIRFSLNTFPTGYAFLRLGKLGFSDILDRLLDHIYIISTPAELYNAVLVDTPLAPFFESCINEQVWGNCLTYIFSQLAFRIWTRWTLRSSGTLFTR